MPPSYQTYFLQVTKAKVEVAGLCGTHLNTLNSLINTKLLDRSSSTRENQIDIYARTDFWSTAGDPSSGYQIFQTFLNVDSIQQNQI